VIAGGIRKSCRNCLGAGAAVREVCYRIGGEQVIMLGDLCVC